MITKINQGLLAHCYNLTDTCAAAVSEEIIKATADIMVDSGLRKAGYEYLVIDGNGPSWRTAHMLDLLNLVPYLLCLSIMLLHKLHSSCTSSSNTCVKYCCRWVVLAE